MSEEYIIDEHAQIVFQSIDIEITPELAKVYHTVKHIHDRIAPGRLKPVDIAIVAAIAELLPIGAGESTEEEEPASIVAKVAEKAAEIVDKAGDGNGKASLSDVIEAGRKISALVSGQTMVGEVIKVAGAIITAKMDGDSRPTRDLDQSKVKVELIKE